MRKSTIDRSIHFLVGLKESSANLDAAYKTFLTELAELPEEAQELMWAEIYEDEPDDDSSPPKGLQSPSSVMKAACKQFTDLVSDRLVIS